MPSVVLNLRLLLLDRSALVAHVCKEFYLLVPSSNHTCASDQDPHHQTFAKYVEIEKVPLVLSVANISAEGRLVMVDHKSI